MGQLVQTAYCFQKIMGLKHSEITVHLYIIEHIDAQLIKMPLIVSVECEGQGPRDDKSLDGDITDI